MSKLAPTFAKHAAAALLVDLMRVARTTLWCGNLYTSSAGVLQGNAASIQHAAITISRKQVRR